MGRGVRRLASGMGVRMGSHPSLDFEKQRFKSRLVLQLQRLVLFLPVEGFSVAYKTVKSDPDRNFPALPVMRPLSIV